jgi:hypothetical protein
MTKHDGKAIDGKRGQRLLEGLQEHPELMERFEAILELTRSDNRQVRSADEIEDLLIQEVRRLGSETMHAWANEAEKQIGQEIQEANAQVRLRKKKP